MDSVESYHNKIDSLYTYLEELLEDYLDVVDVLTQAGICKIISETDKSQIILTKQVATKELWLALPSQGLHFGWHNNRWQTKDNQQLQQVLKVACRQQFGIDLNFDSFEF